MLYNTDPFIMGEYQILYAFHSNQYGDAFGDYDSPHGLGDLIPVRFCGSKGRIPKMERGQVL